MVLIEVLAIVIAAAISILIYFKWHYTYWERKGLPQLKPTFPFGNLENPMKKQYHLGIWIKTFYDHFKKLGEKHFGMYFFSKTIYVVMDPEYIKNIMQKDFQYFVDRGFYYNEKDDPLSAHLFAIGGQKWRKLRTKLTPTFTSGKMKTMFPTLVSCSEQMHKAMVKFCEQKEIIDIKDVLARFTTDVIGSCAFGLECNSFTSSDAEFRKHGKRIFDSKTKYEEIRSSFAFSRPNLARKLGIALLPKDATAFFTKVVKDTLEFRKTNNVSRHDMLQLLIDLKDDITFEEIAAQAFVFFLAGFETSSTTMTFCLYELCMNKDIQDKLRKEINNVLKKHNGNVTYEAIMDMKYLGYVIDETLRKYPPVSFITRDCGANYKIPDSDIILESGIGVIIPVFALHRDPEYYPEPDKFIPERFDDENRKAILPFTYMPFGEGPRLCIGMRFGLLQTKIGLVILLKDFVFSVNEKTKVPIEFDKYSFILSSESGIWLNVEKVSN